MEELEAQRLSLTPVSPAQVSVELNRVLFKIKDLLRQLPPAHYKTLQFLIEHLHRYVSVGSNLESVSLELGILQEIIIITEECFLSAEQYLLTHQGDRAIGGE